MKSLPWWGVTRGIHFVKEKPRLTQHFLECYAWCSSTARAVDELWPFSLKKLLKDELRTDKPWTALELWTAFPRLVHNCEWVHSRSVHKPRWFNFLLSVISNMSPDFLPYWLPPHFYQITVGCIIGCTIGCTEHNWLQNLKPRYVIIAMLSLILVRKKFSQKCMCHSFCWRRRKKSSACAAQTRMNYLTAIQCG